MDFWLEILFAVLSLTLGIGLSFFFSGSETAFYRVNTVRLSIEANEGDRISQRLLSHTRHPGKFVATTLVGNNIANYLISLGSGLATALFVVSGGMAEVLITWAITPIIFVFGELLPKNISYATPSWLLRRGSWFFQLVYWLLIPATLPLAMISRILQRLAGATTGKTDSTFGRTRLTKLFSEGRQHGLLSDAQGRFLTGLLSSSGNRIRELMTPADRVLGMVVANRQLILEHGRVNRLSTIVLRDSAQPGQWTHYIRLADLALSDRAVEELMRPLPRFESNRVRLDVLLELRERREPMGAVVKGDRVIGIVEERNLVDAMFRAGGPLVMATPT